MIAVFLSQVSKMLKKFKHTCDADAMKGKINATMCTFQQKLFPRGVDDVQTWLSPKTWESRDRGYRKFLALFHPDNLPEFTDYEKECCNAFY
jgi:hypothetical protein